MELCAAAAATLILSRSIFSQSRWKDNITEQGLFGMDGQRQPGCYQS
jgi:hypothetical protein